MLKNAIALLIMLIACISNASQKPFNFSTSKDDLTSAASAAGHVQGLKPQRTEKAGSKRKCRDQSPSSSASSSAALSSSSFGSAGSAGAASAAPMLSFPVGKSPTSIAYSLNGKWAAVTNPKSHNIIVFQVNRDTGAWTQLPDSSCVLEDKHPTCVAYSDNNKSAATVNYKEQSLSVLKVNQITGALEGIQSIVYGDGGTNETVLSNVDLPAAIQYSADSRWAIAISYDLSEADVFKVDQASGMFETPSKSDIESASYPLAEEYRIVDGSSDQIRTLFNKALGKVLKIVGLSYCGHRRVWTDCSANGKWIAIISASSLQASEEMTIFQIDQAKKILIPVDHLSLTYQVGPIQYSPDSRWLAVRDHFGKKIIIFQVNQDTGSLTQIAGSPFAIGARPAGLKYSPDSLCLAVANHEENTVWVYEVDQETGALSRITGDKLQVVQKYERAAKELKDENLIPIPGILAILREYMVEPNLAERKQPTATIEESRE